ncbi:MAG: YaaR family protein [Desulfitobacteriaceae bacterium]
MAFRIDPAFHPNQAAIDNPTPTEKTSAGFDQALTQVQKLQRKEFEDFLSRLGVQGEKLAKSLSVRDLADFKEMVKGFLRSTLGQSRKMQEESFWDFHGRPKVMSRVAHIDQALEELGRKVLTEQDKPLEILSKIDEIRGLLVDLFA